MSTVNESGLRGGMAALLQSYVADLRAWATKLAGGYAVAAAILVASVLALFGAIAVGITALFRVLERNYGAEVAYGGIGGGLFVIAIVLFLIGLAMLRRRIPPLPRPHRQAEAAKRRLIAPAALGAIGWSRAVTAKADPTTGLLIAAAAAMLVGWIAAVRLRSQRRR
jgi:hypothetical protein